MTTDDKHAALRERLLNAHSDCAKQDTYIKNAITDAIAALTPAPATSGTDDVVNEIIALIRPRVEDEVKDGRGNMACFDRARMEALAKALARYDAILATTPTPVAVADDEAGRMLDWLEKNKCDVSEVHGEWYTYSGLIENTSAHPTLREAIRAAMAQGGNNE